MRLARSPAVQIVCGLLILAACAIASPKVTSTSGDNDEDDSYSDEEVPKNHHRKQLEDEIDLDDAFDAEQLKNEQLPILPPIILLDFVNGTDDPNSTDTSDEKSKRTIDDSLGYGFNRNNLFSGKHNFYFPAGKTGTAVSIEESISLAPKTVTEIVQPINEKTDPDNSENEQTKQTRQSLFEAMPAPLPLESGREPPPLYPPFPVFGQRTKLQKTSSSDFGHYQSRPGTKQFSSSYSTSATPGSESYSKLLASYSSMKPAGYQTGSSGYPSSTNVNGYARPMTSPYLKNYMSDIYSSSSSQKSSYDVRPAAATGSGSSNQEFNFANYPRYTIENGIKYEHKIVWKYPDGKISEKPPMSYVNSYSEYAEPQRINAANTNGFRPSTPYQQRPATSQQHQHASGTSYNPSVGGTQNNIYSQRPVQFPNDQEQPNINKLKMPSRFVSPSSAGIPPGNQYETGNAYNVAAYQGQYGMRQNPKPNGYRVSEGYNSEYNSYPNHRPVAKYPVNSPSADYHYQREHVQGENLFSANGQINQQVLSKYTPEAQQYLKKVFAAGKTTSKTEYQSDIPAGYANTDYSNLLNYNPSISQYIKNPSSILNAQPTFIQAGNSLIPVIILRVDGAPPIQPKVGSNINLKSLLRQYLTQYANSVSKVTQNTNYDLGGAVDNEDVSASQPNPVEDLKHLTETLASLRQRGHQDPDFTTSYINSYGQQPQGSQHHQHQQQQQQPSQPQQSSVSGGDYVSNYKDFVKDYQKIYEGQVRKPQKVKSVQIIEDPRYTSYKVDN